MVAIKMHNRDSNQGKYRSVFKTLTIFSGLAPEVISRFSDVAQTITRKKGEILYMEGETAEFFYIILSGWVKLFHITEDGEEVILAVLTKNSVIGESSIFEDGRYTSSTQAVEHAQILSIPLIMLKEQLSIDNQLARNMLTSMVHHQRYHELQLEQYMRYSAPQRIGCFLLGLCPKMEQKDGMVIQLPYDKTLIASTLGMKGATFSRALNILRDEVGIHVAGTEVKISSIKRLLEFVDGCYIRKN
jgi:CRP-like cAMP-binding protein